MQAISKVQPLLSCSLSVLRCHGQNERANATWSRILETRSGSAPSKSRIQLSSNAFNEQSRQGHFTRTRSPKVARWRCSGKQEPDSASDPVLDGSDPAAYNNYCATLKKFKDLRFKLVSEASLLGLLVWQSVVHHDDYLTLVNGYPPEPNLPPVVPILFAITLLFAAPCRGDFWEMRDLEQRCDELRKGLPAGLEARPLRWDSEDEESLRYHLTDKPVSDFIRFVIGAGITWILWLAYTARSPVAVDTIDRQIRYGFIFSMIWSLVETVFPQVIKILALQARKRESV